MKQATPRLAAAFFAVVAVALMPGHASAETDTEPLRVLMITGGGWHDYEAQKDILADGIAERTRNVDMTIDFEGGDDAAARLTRHENDDWAHEFGLVLYNMCYSGVEDVDYIERIVDVHAEHDLPAVLLHCAAHTYRHAGSEKWFHFVGLRSMRHQSHMPFTVEVLEPDHPAMTGFPDGWQTPQGELYEVEQLMPNTTPLAQAYGEDSGQHHVNVWANHYEGARVFGTTIGHHNETMETDVYLNLVTQGLLWAADLRDAQGEPKPAYASQ